MIKKNKIKIRELIIKVIEISIGCIILAFGISVFLLPNQLSSGGFSGISTIFYYLFKTKIGTTLFVLNIPLMILAFFRFGKLFILKAIVRNSFTICFFKYF